MSAEVAGQLITRVSIPFSRSTPAVISQVNELEAAKGAPPAAPAQATEEQKETEPQNDLTAAFTKQDWEGVKHLRVNIRPFRSLVTGPHYPLV